MMIHEGRGRTRGTGGRQDKSCFGAIALGTNKTKKGRHGEERGAENYRNKERIEDMDEGNGALAGRGGGGAREKTPTPLPLRGEDMPQQPLPFKFQ